MTRVRVTCVICGGCTVWSIEVRLIRYDSGRIDYSFTHRRCGVETRREADPYDVSMLLHAGCRLLPHQLVIDLEDVAALHRGLVLLDAAETVDDLFEVAT